MPSTVDKCVRRFLNIYEVITFDIEEIVSLKLDKYESFREKKKFLSDYCYPINEINIF